MNEEQEIRPRSSSSSSVRFREEKKERNILWI